MLNITEPTKSTPILKVESITTDPSLTCKYCKRQFSRSDSLRRHLESYCPTKLAEEAKKESIRKEYLLELQQQGLINNQNITIGDIDNSVNNTVNVNNNNVNIQLVGYGKEDKTLTDFQILKILNKGFHSVPELFRMLHYDPEKPENQNIYLSNIRSNYVQLFDGQRWITKDLKETLENIFDESRNFLVEMKEEIKEKTAGKKRQMAIINKFERFDYDIDEYPKKLKEIINTIKFDMYNNRDLVIQTKNLYEKQQKRTKT